MYIYIYIYIYIHTCICSHIHIHMYTIMHIHCHITRHDEDMQIRSLEHRLASEFRSVTLTAEDYRWCAGFSQAN